MEERRPEQTLARIYYNGTEEGPAFVVSDGGGGVRVGEARVLVVPFPLGRGFWVRDADWVVYVYLLKEQVAVVEAEAGHVSDLSRRRILGLISRFDCK